MHCDGCGREDAWTIRTWKDGDSWNGSCNFCSSFSGPAVDDVYFPGAHSCQNLTDDKGVPVHFETRSQKARFMKEKGISEVGDRVRGARMLPKPSGKTWYQQLRNAGKIK